MGKHALAERNKEKITKLKGRLTPDQLKFAEWLALSTIERRTETQKEFAARLGVSQQSLCNWKEMPELWEVQNSLMTSRAKEMVPDAIKIYENALKDPHSVTKVQFEIAKDILNRWAEPRGRPSVMTSILDMYESYKEGE